MTAQVEAVYYGKRDDMIAEVAAWNPLEIDVPSRKCAYLVMPYGDAQFDTEWCSSRKVAAEIARDIANQYEGCKVVSLCHK